VHTPVGGTNPNSYQGSLQTIEQNSIGEKMVKMEYGEEISRVDPKGSISKKPIIKGVQGRDKTPLDYSGTEGGGGRILVVDDEKDIRDVFSKVLRILGYEVVVASSGTEGLNLFLTSPFDLVLTEFQMPGMDGWSLAFHIKDRFPNTPVVMITRQEREGVMEKIKGSCVDFVMFKPSRLEDILKTVQRMLDAGSEETTTSALLNNPAVPQKGLG
jgi:CheY-like chemotaxis protein